MSSCEVSIGQPTVIDVCGSSAILLAVHLARTTIEPLQRVSDKHRPTGSDQQFCVRDTAYDWRRSYLSSRIQSFNFADQQTGPYPLDSSVPQGSVLGPLKFIAYTENGVNVIKHHNVNVFVCGRHAAV